MAAPNVDAVKTGRQLRGATAEQQAADYLEGSGWRVVARNLKVGRDEVDVVAIDPGPRAHWSSSRCAASARRRSELLRSESTVRRSAVRIVRWPVSATPWKRTTTLGCPVESIS